MENKDFFAALDALELEKGISKEAFISTLETALVSAYKKHTGTSAAISVKLIPERNGIKIYATKLVVEEVSDNDNEIAWEDAVKEKKSIKVGEELITEIKPKDFGRIAAQTAKQVIIQRLREFEKDAAMNEFTEKENEILTGIIRRTDGQTYYLDLGKGQIEGVLLPQDQIKTERYRLNDRVKVFVKKVRTTSNGPQVIVSRSSAGLVRKFFENEVPEIRQGIVEIKSVAREAGQRTKIAIYSSDENVDAVGACVGAKGVRVNAIVTELGGEKIDIIPWCEDPLEFIARSLSPAEVKYVEGSEDEKKARVVVADDKLSLAIGKEGQNARLAARLTGWKIDVKSQSQFEKENAVKEEDIEL
ncbi:MAG: transcription termination/antitermination protein NusA [Clostridia bacterium]|nr:transcription termination/antitermination protein NusA [Clostridia bacterium]